MDVENEQPDDTDDERRAILEMMAKGSYAVILLATADLDGTFERVQASGAEGRASPGRIESEFSVDRRLSWFRSP